MPEWYKKRILQRPGNETQAVTERPSEFYQLELPDFKIPTVTNSEGSIITSLANRKWRDLYNQAYDEYLEQHPISPLSGIGYNPYIGTQFNPEVQRQQAAHLYAQDKSGYVTSDPTAPYKQADETFANVSNSVLGASLFAPEFASLGLLRGSIRLGSGMAGSWVGSKLGKEVGYAIDKTLGTGWGQPTGELAGAFAGWGKGQKLANIKWTTYRPIPTATKQTKSFKNPLKAITSGKKVYTSPLIKKSSFVPQTAFASDFSGVENVEQGNFGYGGVKPNFGLRNLKTEQRSKQLLDSVAEEEKRNASAINWTEKNWNNLTPTEQYWLKTNHGNEWNDKSIIQRMNINNK